MDICGLIVGSEDLQYSCWSHTSHESILPSLNTLSTHTLCLCRKLVWSLYFTVACLSFFSVSLFFFPSYHFVVVCENREEPWSWFQYLWWHQRPGEPLQTLRHGTTRPRPASQSQPPRALPQSCHGNCCSFTRSVWSVRLGSTLSLWP